MKHGKPVRLTGDGQSNLIMNPEPAAADDQNNIFNAEADAGFVQLDRRRNSVFGARSASDSGALSRQTSTPTITTEPSTELVLSDPPAPTPSVHDVTPPLTVDRKPVWEGAEECTARNSCVKITRKNRFGENKTPLRVKLENDIRTDILNNHHPAVAPPGTRPKTVCDHKMGFQKKLVFEGSNIAALDVLVERDQDFRGMVLVSKMDNSASRSTSSTEAGDSEFFEVFADHLREPDDSPCLMPASVSPFHPDHQNLQQSIRHVPKTEVQSENYDHLEEDGVFVATMQLVLNWPLKIPAYRYDPRNKQIAQFKWSDVMFRLMAGKRHFVRVITGKGHFLIPLGQPQLRYVLKHIQRDETTDQTTIKDLEWKNLISESLYHQFRNAVSPAVDGGDDVAVLKVDFHTVAKFEDAVAHSMDQWKNNWRQRDANEE